MKRHYITEINRFHEWLETNQIPKSAIALWHGLMHINNKAEWSDTFTVAIQTIESKTGFKRSELFEARNILTQKGRIKWRQRGGNLCAEYEIIFFCVHIADASTDAKAYTVPDAKAYTKPTQKHTINKTILEENRLKDIDGDKSPDQKFSFKNFSEEQFIQELRQYADKYPREMMNAFFKYWKEKTPKGKMRFQLEKTWETNLRLEKWQDNQQKFEIKKTTHAGHTPNNHTVGKTIQFDQP